MSENSTEHFERRVKRVISGLKFIATSRSAKLSDADKRVLWGALAICGGLLGDRPEVDAGTGESAGESGTSTPPKAPTLVVDPDYPNRGTRWGPVETNDVAAQVASGSVDVLGLSKDHGRTPFSIALKAVSQGFMDEAWAEQYRYPPGHIPPAVDTEEGI